VKTSRSLYTNREDDGEEAYSHWCVKRHIRRSRDVPRLIPCAEDTVLMPFLSIKREWGLLLSDMLDGVRVLGYEACR